MNAGTEAEHGKKLEDVQALQLPERTARPWVNHQFLSISVPRQAVPRRSGTEPYRRVVNRFEGRRTRLLYRGPEERFTLEILRNYRSALEEAGFETLFTCSEDECGRLFTWLLYHGEKQMKTGANGGFDHAKDLRYLAAKLTTSELETWVSLMIAVDPIFTKKPVTLLEIVEGDPMDTEMVRSVRGHPLACLLLHLASASRP